MPSMAIDKDQHLYSSEFFKIHQISEQLVQAILWCATARCGGTKGGTTTAGRWFVAQLNYHPKDRAVNVLASRYKYY